MTQTVYTLRKAHTVSLYTVQVRERPSVLAFESKQAAQTFAAMHEQFRNNTLSPICVDDMCLQRLHRRCSMNALSLTVCNKEGVFETLESISKTNDDVQFHLDNVLMYVSDYASVDDSSTGVLVTSSPTTAWASPLISTLASPSGGTTSSTITVFWAWALAFISSTRRR